ncbi:NYN domain-containing protein [Telluribacter sp. SYSU D00476]|uniref:NYN domain-containing protein n=1 Tax=Telluribacter sp. SYSU D00476 TaxID=2811430 RepID=UPI001FF628CF|nr:NYN domain-containing protein [Telluribacter sp. SYSU D00476]
MITTDRDLRLAVLIDADNVPYSTLQEMLEEIARYGTPTFKRIYGDWTNPRLVGWKAVLLENAITPVQQYSYTSGKNATDSAMIIDAMDILYTGRVDGFCIVSSDSDFTRLAIRLREAGMKVFGMGEQKTPVSFTSACDRFIYIEILRRNRDAESGGNEQDEPAEPNEQVDAKAKPASRRKTPKSDPSDKKLRNLISSSINDLADEDGWVFLGDLGNLLIKKRPSFDSRSYGFSKLLPLIKSIGAFEIDERETGKSNIRHVYVRNK